MPQLSSTVSLKQCFFFVLLAIIFIAIIIILVRKEKFDLTTDPLRSSYSYEKQNCSSYPQAQRNGLNTESNRNIDICNFNKLYNKNTTFVENVNTDPYAISARQLCSVLYSNHQEYFTNMWSGLGECEIYQTEQAKKCPNKIKIDKQSTYFPTSPNL